MSEVQVIKNISHQKNSALKSISAHKNESCKHKYIDSQNHIDSNQNESIQQIPNPNNMEGTKKILSKNESEKVQTIRKCIRKGSRVCYTDMENITVLRKIPERDTSKSSAKSNEDSEVFEKIDSYRSGESLFKTFTFEQTRDIDDPETVKCIEFWKSVMKKNLAPIKCTLIESNKKSKEKKKGKSLLSTVNKKRENRESDAKKDKFDFTGDGARIWSEALKEIRKKKLDQLKLYVRERCQYCTDPFTKNLKDNWGVEDLGEQEAQIISLNSWKPKEEQIDLAHSLETPRKRSTLKNRKTTTSQTVETRINEKPDDLDQQQRENSNNQSKAKIVIPGDGVGAVGASFDKQEPPKRLPSILKGSSGVSAISDSSRRQTAARMTSAEVQAPNIKCPCDSDTCVCPHRMAARNSRSSFVEIVRKNMLTQDASIEKFFPTTGESCICQSFNPQPWQKLSCFNKPCPAKLPKIRVMESSSDFDLTSIVENNDICVCTKKLDVVCPSKNCKNKMSQGSLFEGVPHVKDDKEDFCVCTTEPGAPCISDVCPVKAPKEVSTRCVCGNNLPWSQATCKSWKCQYHQVIRRKRDNNEDKTKFKGHPPIKKVTSTCMCQEGLAWNDVKCDCELCISRSKPTPIPTVKDRKGSILKTTKSGSKEPMSNPSFELLNREKENVRPKIPTVDKCNGCICSVAPPWKIVTCTSCGIKDTIEGSKTNVTPFSDDCISIAKDEDCVCKDSYIEPICKMHDCKNKKVSAEYPPPCICPKDLDESKHEYFRCLSESCTMKKIDKTCLCRSEPDAPCDVKTCVSKPQASERLIKSKKPLKYNAKCICKVRGLPTTQEVTCVAPECPFQKKYPKVSKKKQPMLFVPPAYENRSFADEMANKCICSTKDSPKNITCRSQSCRRIQDHSSTDYHDQEQCICKGELTDVGKEVICNQIQCPKKSVGEDGTVMIDKCVCANLDQTCNEPTCPSKDNGMQHIIYNDLSHEMDRPYCYICGHYDCVSASKKTANTKFCEDVYTDIDDM